MFIFGDVCMKCKFCEHIAPIMLGKGDTGTEEFIQAKREDFLGMDCLVPILVCPKCGKEQ